MKMPRNADNNPTERIGRLMDEMAELVGIMQAYMPEMLPRLPMFEAEKVRRSLTYTRNVNRMRTRKLMNKAMPSTYRTMQAAEKFNHEDAQRLADEMTQPEPLSLDEIESMVAQSKRDEANAIIERGKFKSADTYVADKKNLFSKTKRSSDEEAGS